MIFIPRVIADHRGDAERQFIVALIENKRARLLNYAAITFATGVSLIPMALRAIDSVLIFFIVFFALMLVILVLEMANTPHRYVVFPWHSTDNTDDDLEHARDFCIAHNIKLREFNGYTKPVFTFSRAQDVVLFKLFFQ